MSTCSIIISTSPLVSQSVYVHGHVPRNVATTSVCRNYAETLHWNYYVPRKVICVQYVVVNKHNMHCRFLCVCLENKPNISCLLIFQFSLKATYKKWMAWNFSILVTQPRILQSNAMLRKFKFSGSAQKKSVRKDLSGFFAVRATAPLARGQKSGKERSCAICANIMYFNFSNITSSNLFALLSSEFLFFMF